MTLTVSVPRRLPKPTGALRPGRTIGAVLSLLALLGLRVVADDLADARTLLRTGKYEPCVALCEKQAADAYPAEEWKSVHVGALLAIGRYEQAETVVSNALVKAENSIRLRLLGIETANRSGNPTRAESRLKQINELGTSRLWAYREAADLVALGRVALRLGADPKSVLERLFMPARKAAPDLRDAWIASGELALGKNDFALAAKTYTEALKQFPDDPDLLYGLALAYRPSTPKKTGELIDQVLEKNENHVPSLLLTVDHLVDAEEYGEAEKLLVRALKVNPWHPEAWAYRAVLAHLRNDVQAEAEARGQGLKFWKTNPEVDHLVGRKLSQKYRFSEGAACQRRALIFDPNYLPARMQLAEDLLRLGEEAEGWKLAEDVHQRDGYDVTAYNLVTLRGTMDKFQAVTNEHFVIRMSAPEARLYGDRALALLERARSRLAEKYGVELASPTIVEIFPEQKDFGVRTFGMPGNPGFLGVCFGRVITANSPASQAGHPNSWEAVLWHEFCHVVTLQMTQNKMPRWLSEGISVYEELQANPGWGQTINPRFREMILGDDLKPVRELSAAFLTPKSDLHVQFAYLQSALVVEFLVDRYGFDRLKAILRDLADGMDINESIPKRTVRMAEFEKEFATFAKARAESLGPGLDWKRPDTARRALNRLRPEGADPLPPKPTLPPDATADSVGRNFWALMELAGRLVSEGKWAEAKAPLQTLIELCPSHTGPDNAYALLAAAHKGLNETAEERAALEKWAALDADALDAFLRLMELAASAQDWKGVAQNAERSIAVNPLLPQPYRQLGRAWEELGEPAQAIGAYRKLLLLDPPDPAEVHFRLARLLQREGDPSAKREALQALEEAPRFREAHRLLLEVAKAKDASTNAPPAATKP